MRVQARRKVGRVRSRRDNRGGHSVASCRGSSRACSLARRKARDWSRGELLPLAHSELADDQNDDNDDEDFIRISVLINGARTGTDSRHPYWTRAKEALKNA
jgi:hypothetical protein